MSKAFWEGFFEGFYKASVILNPFIILTLVAILVATHYYHPYEQCKRMYETPEDISECVWIKENP